MAVDFNKPVVTDLRASVLQYIRDYMAAQSKLFDGETLTGTPTGAIRYSQGNTRFEKWSGSAWVALSQSYLPIAGGTLTGALEGTSANFTSALNFQGNAVWHAGNFNPANYQPVASAWNTGNFNPSNYQLASTAWNSSNFNPSNYQAASSAWNTSNFDPSTKQNVSTAWNTGNFNPANYAPLAGATFTGAVTVNGGLSSPAVNATGTGAYVGFQDRTDPGTVAWNWYSVGGIARLYGNGNDRLTVSPAGAVGCASLTATGDVQAFSDRRLKEQFFPEDLSLSELAGIQSYNYRRKDTGALECGVIAQDVQHVLPRAVHVARHPIDEKEMLALDYGRFAAVAVVSLAREVRRLRAELGSR